MALAAALCDSASMPTYLYRAAQVGLLVFCGRLSGSADMFEDIPGSTMCTRSRSV